MASRTEGFDEIILESAKREFLDKGFTAASIRNIASAAGVSTSTIYTRFRDKEGLFRHLVEPASSSMIAYISLALGNFRELPIEEQLVNRSDFRDHVFPGLIDLIYGHFDEFRLLVGCAPENFFYDFLSSLAEVDMNFTKDFLRDIKCEAYLSGRLKDGFLHVLSTGYYAGIFEIIIQDMPRDDAEEHLATLRRFYTRGWSEYI